MTTTWDDYDAAALNGFLNQVVKTSDDFARWNVFLMFRGGGNEGDDFLTNARDFLAREGYEPESATSIRKTGATT